MATLIFIRLYGVHNFQILQNLPGKLKYQLHLFMETYCNIIAIYSCLSTNGIVNYPNLDLSGFRIPTVSFSKTSLGISIKF